MEGFKYRTAARWIAAASLLAATYVSAQGPGPRGQGGGPPRGQSSVSADDFVARFMAFDADGNGVISKQEVTDARLTPLVDRIDADKDGTITKDEMTAYFTRESEAMQRAGGPGGFGPPGGPGAFGPPRPGQVLPSPVQEMLQLTDDQKAEIAKLQEDVDKRLANILTPEQREQLREMGNRGPGGPQRGPGGSRGGAGGSGGPGGTGGPPPR